MAKPDPLVITYVSTYLSGHVEYPFQYATFLYDGKFAVVDSFEQADVMREFLEALDVPIEVRIIEEEESNEKQVRGNSIQEAKGM